MGSPERVDRIAEAAQANKRLIYVYYGSKEQLFDVVLAQRVGVWRWPEQAACGRGEGCAPLLQALRRPRVHDSHL